jgi:hypothetical protein
MLNLPGMHSSLCKAIIGPRASRAGSLALLLRR